METAESGRLRDNIGLLMIFFFFTNLRFFLPESHDLDPTFDKFQSAMVVSKSGAIIGNV